MAGAAVATSKSNNLPPENAGVGFAHGTPVGVWPDNQYKVGAPLASMAQCYSDIKHHGSIVMHEGELYIRKPGGQWRQIS